MLTTSHALLLLSQQNSNKIANKSPKNCREIAAKIGDSLKSRMKPHQEWNDAQLKNRLYATDEGLLISPKRLALEKAFWHFTTRLFFIISSRMEWPM